MIVGDSVAGAPPPPASSMSAAASSRLYVSLNKDHRVSRTFRATWYLKRLIAHSTQQNNVEQDNVEQTTEERDDIQVLGGSSERVNPETQVFYICQQYSLVFVLDMSTNMRAVSNAHFCVKLNEAVRSLCGCIELLARPFCVGGEEGVMCEPKLCVTVLGHCGSASDKPIQVFMQGVYVDQTNCSQLVSSLREDLNKQENLLASASPKTRMETGVNGDATLEAMLRAGTLAIQLLPRSALKGVVLVTDGISGFPTPSAMHNTVAAMSSSNVSCWVIHVGGAPHPNAPLGLIPDLETLNFITRACNGCVIQPHKVMAAVEMPRPQERGVAGPNVVQEAVLLWSFQLCSLDYRVRGVVKEGCQISEDPFVPIIHRVFYKNSITAQLLCVVGCKIREGFFLKSVQVKDVMVEVCLCYLWQPSVNIYYTISAPWPVCEAREVLQVTTSYDGPYSFIHDFQCEVNPQSLTTYRATAIRKFKQSLQKFSNSDALLAHFLSFPVTSSLHELPTSVQNGTPLFHSLPASTKSIAVNTPGGKSTALHQFWRPLCTVDTSQWYRWFHSDKLVLILRPEFPLPKNLLEKSASGRYGNPLCRPAASHLFNFLKGWSSLVLLEGHSYIRWLPYEESPPQYFCLVRVAQKYPCMVLHIGYIEGTPHSLQSHTVASLIQGLQKLAPPTKDRNVGGASKKRASLAAATGNHEVTILEKQLQRVMIRYESFTSSTSTSLLPALVQPDTASEKLTQMEYLQCSCWEWHVPHTTPHILTALLKCRLKEGYHVISAHNGVVTLTAQLTLQQPSCPGHQYLLLQYVIFPYGGVLKSELWVEPQCGVICATPPGLKYLQGLGYPDIAKQVHAVDYALVTEVTSFAHLLHTCQTGLPSLPVAAEGGVAGDGRAGVVEFQLTSLFDKSNVCVLTVAAFSEDMCGATGVPLDKCSTLNQQFWHSISAHIQTMAPTSVPLSDHTHILQRLQASPELQQLFAVLDLQHTVEWTCVAMVTSDNELIVFLLPWQLYSDCRDEGRGVALLPIVMFQCCQEQLLNSNLAESRPTEDVYLHFDLQTQPILTEVCPGLKDLLCQLRSLHTSCYLEQVHAALVQGLLLTQQDFLRGVTVCQTNTLSVDLTPLLAGLCAHSLTEFPSSPELGTKSAPLPSDVLSHLLSAALSKLTYTCVVRGGGREEGGAGEECQLRTQQINQTFRRHLDKLGLRAVTQCEQAYFWLDNENPKPEASKERLVELQTGLVPVEEEEESTYSGMKPSVVVDSSSSDEEQDMILEPLLSPPAEELNTSTGGVAVPAAPPPLFLRVSCAVRDSTGMYKKELCLGNQCLSSCLASLLGDGSAGEGVCLSVELTFSCLSEDSTDTHHQSATLSSLPQCYHHIALGLQSYLQWLICDELVSVGHCGEPVSAGLLQSVATHVQTSHNTLSTCFSQQIPLKFVFGAINSMSHFSQHLETMEVPNYQLVKLEDFYYLKPEPRPSSSVHHGDLTPDLMSSASDVRIPSGRHHIDQSYEPAMERSRTPPPPQLAPPGVARGHRRSMSSGHVYDSAPKVKSSGQASRAGSELELAHKTKMSSVQTSIAGSELDMELASVEVGSGYEGGLSDDASSMSELIQMKSSPAVCVSVGCEAWVLLRVVSNQVDLYFQLRSCQEVEEAVRAELRVVCDQVVASVQYSCRRTNQWLLMKSMLDTRVCSPYLLSESASEAWVEEVVLQQARTESFRAQEFMCELVHRNFITPHWRIRDMKAQAALLITRSALSAFAVTNRRDVYVLQDISATGEESIFYVKVDESLCNVENTASTEPSITLERRDTLDADETQSMFSYQQSLLSEVPEVEKKAPATVDPLPFHTSGSKPQESLVVQVYGISRPSQEFKDRLNGTIQHKLEATALDIMCGLYARNQNLKLSPEDVEFLQPDRKPTHTLHLSLPNWILQEYYHPFFYYFLQILSTFTLSPSYAGQQSKQLQAHQELHNAYLVERYSYEGLKDHLFLYIRPQVKGRGMAVLCVSLVDDSGRVQAPSPGLTAAMCAVEGEGGGGRLKEGQLECRVSEDKAMLGCYSIRIHVWEKGNIGLEEFMHKLEQSFVHTVLDYYLELCLLSCPLAQPTKPGTDMDMLIDDTLPLSGGCGPRDSPLFSGPQSPSKELLSKTAAAETPRKKTSVVSYKSSSSSRRSSDSVSRRGSGLSESRRGSGLVSESRRMSTLGSESKRGSLQGSEGRRESDLSRKSSLALADHRRQSGERGRSEEVWSNKIPEGVIEEADEWARSSTASSLELQTSLDLSARLEGIEGEGQSPWLQKEKTRRFHEALESLVRDAELGRCGVLTETFSTHILQHLSLAHKRGSPSVQHVNVPLKGHYSTKGFVSELLTVLESACSNTSSDVFQLTPSGYVHVCALRDWAKVERKVLGHLYPSQFMLLTRSVGQWEECEKKQSLDEFGPPQLFAALDSSKTQSLPAPPPPLQTVAEAKSVFIPRRMLVILHVSRHKSEVWLYNCSDHCCKTILHQLSSIQEQLATRSGLLHHLLAQKMGLYRHCNGQDLRSSSKLAVNHCSTVQDVVKLIKNVIPANESVKPLLPRRPAPAYEHISVESMYQDQPPYGPVLLSEDPLTNHGHQFRDWNSKHRKELERVTLLGKVFRSWLSHEDANVPVNPDVIANLKRTARLLHYCSSPLLLQQCLTTPTVTSHGEWLTTSKEQLLSHYINYLLVLGFQLINERAHSKVKPSSRAPKVPQPQAIPYKCLQRSWLGGIIMVELLFQQQLFVVKLYTLEGSRLQQSSPLSPESRSQFAKECARYKDFIHVHSFMYDFHLRLLLEQLSGQGPQQQQLDLCEFMDLCHQHYQPLPNFAHNLLKKESLRVPTSVQPELLYRHLLSHCKEFGTTTFELQASDNAGPSTAQIGLLINIQGDSIGAVTTPELSQLMEGNKDSYSTKVLAVYKPDHTPTTSREQYLELAFYLLLVNSEEKFPCLTSDLPVLTASCHAVPPSVSEDLTEESDLNVQVREHRRRMGYGLMATPTASRQVLSAEKVGSQVHAVRTHLESVIRRALHHMRKDELWKRLLYGASYSTEGRTMPLSDLVFADFRDLLHLVKECPLDSLDPRLAHLKKQPRKWFKKLFKALRLRFTENIRVYSNDDESQTYAAIINPDWQDMLVLVQSSNDSRHQGLSAVYRKHMEGGIPLKERHITANLEADRHHIETVVNFCCSFMWASILDAAPPLPQLNLL